MAQEPQAPKSTGDRVAEWIETSGTALELRVASAFAQKFGPQQTAHSVAYTDRETGKQREIDVVSTMPSYHLGFGGSTRGGAFQLTAVVECKSSDAHPWIALSKSEQTPHYRGDEFLDEMPTVWKGGASDSIATMGRRLLAPTTEPFAYDVTNGAQSSATKSRDEQRDLAWNASRQVLSAAFGLRAVDHHLDNNSVLVRSIYVPVIVTGAEIYRVSIDRQGRIVQVPVSMIPWRLRIKIGGGALEPRSVWVVTESAVPELIDAFDQAVRAPGPDL